MCRLGRSLEKSAHITFTIGLGLAERKSSRRGDPFLPWSGIEEGQAVGVGPEEVAAADAAAIAGHSFADVGDRLRP